jgi:hypothetical protein
MSFKRWLENDEELLLALFTARSRCCTTQQWQAIKLPLPSDREARSARAIAPRIPVCAMKPSITRWNNARHIKPLQVPLIT